MALAADAVRGVGAAERDALIDRDIVADLGGLADDDAETMIDEEVPADLRARMDVDRGQETRQVIDEAREEEQPRFEQPVRDAVHTAREQPRIETHFPARTRRWLPRLNRLQIGNQPLANIMYPT